MGGFALGSIMYLWDILKWPQYRGGGSQFRDQSSPCLSLQCAGVYVPLGGKKLLTFMDDFNMPAKDTFGSQPPLELIKQWIDYNFWYDRQKQTVKHIKVRGRRFECWLNS